MENPFAAGGTRSITASPEEGNTIPVHNMKNAKSMPISVPGHDVTTSPALRASNTALEWPQYTHQTRSNVVDVRDEQSETGKERHDKGKSIGNI